MEPISMAIGTAISLGSSLIGWLMERGASEEAQRIVQRAQDEYGNLDPLTLEKIAYEELGPSAMESIKVDPTYREAQFAALDKLKEVSDSGGMTLADRAAQNEATATAQRAESAGFNRITNDMDARGMGSSGSRLALLFGNQQASADRYSRAALDTAGQAQQRALDAILKRGEMAGGMRSQEFGEQSQIAQARDRIAQYNNGVRNQQTYHNTYTVPTANHASKVAGSQRRYGVAKDRADMVMDRARSDRQTIAGVGHAVGGAVNYAGQKGWLGGQPAPVADVEPAEMFDENDPWRYR